MIKVTVWNEYVQERGLDAIPNYEQLPQDIQEHFQKSAIAIKEVHPNGIHNTLKGIFEEDEEFVVRTVTMDMPECGLTKEVLDDTDVLVWWAHVAHNKVPDEIALRVKRYVNAGMGFIGLHSAHPSKPMQYILGATGRLQWREGDRARVWCVNPTHPIAKGIPQSFELPEEEMYGEYFDIPKPDDLVFISWFAGGEVFRSGCTWTRGLGKIFYFQPGHETQRSYHVPEVRQIIRNAAHWAKPVMKIDVPTEEQLAVGRDFACPHAQVSPEAKLKA